ncbi:hypothetical protein D9619_010012 [Psilocybe cf. subviscida]|uniref:F-box domain-containing protein n=1 Tax=Psilocybe cf. subviscida TaxID=2480587 RepID=A0A8H5BKS3_9AGAR|nr:hypothetical protein D9619_010012 [Psilocybe cf. subviscida]
MGTEDSYLEVQRTIDLELTNLSALTQETTRQLNSRRNALAPAFKLPDDVLVDIFLSIRDSSDRRPKNWHQITQICGYWRSVAVMAPSLWTSFYDPPHALTPLMLERSQAAPLDVYFSNLKRKHSTTTLMSILHNIERIRTLAFGTMPSDFLDTIHNALANVGWNWKSSLLESLTVGIMYNPAPRSGSVRVAMEVFRPTCLLRKLYLTGGHYDWNMLPLPSLTHLDLYGESLSEVSGAQFIETLRHMQNLEVLGIEWESMNLRQYPPTPCPQPIHLPYLRKLEIVKGHQDHIESFLSLVTHPRLHQLSLGSSDPVNDIVTFIQSATSSVGKGQFRPLEFLRIEFEYVTMSAAPWLSDSDESYIHIDAPIDEEEFDPNDDGRGFEFIADILSCITPFDCPAKIPLRHIYLDSWDVPIDDFSHLFASLPHLESIEVHHNLALALFRILNIASTSENLTPDVPIPFPKLQKIVWNGDHQYSRSVPVLSATLYNELYNGLLFRHARGVPITRLELVGCERLVENQANQLEEIGVVIVVRQR